MMIHIPSRGRHDKILTEGTLSQFPERLLEKTWVWVAFAEAEAYMHALRDTPVHVHPVKICTVGADGPAENELSDIHQAIADYDDGEPCFLLADDDLRFAYRADPVQVALTRCKPPDVWRMYSWMVAASQSSPLVSITPRQGNNRHGSEPLKTGPTRSWIAYDRRFLKNHRIRLDRTISKNDYDVALQIYRTGTTAQISTIHTSDQALGGSAKGGSMITRTPHRHTLASNQLAALHPEYVTVVTKDPPSWGPEWAAGRTDVRVSWKAAYQNGLASRSTGR